jgi:hypothetical protein
VLTCPTGAAPELLEDGVTGYTSMEPEMLAVAAQHISRISRRGCRAYAQQRFDTSMMASNYLNVYQQVLGNQHLLLPLAKELSVADYEDASASDAYNTHHPHHTRHSHHH